VAIIDYKMGNLYSVARACETAGLNAIITDKKDELLQANGVLLPGVGAFGGAMKALHSADLVPVIKDIIQKGVPFMGICLGMQLLLSTSEEFGLTKGLAIIPGEVVRFPLQTQGNYSYKVPQVQWNKIEKCGSWETSLIAQCPNSSFMYFIHSYYVKPFDSRIIVSTSIYGQSNFCSSFQLDNIFACQFHPEKSGALGLDIYKEFSQRVMKFNP
jgi:glutamine amidotransferase